MGDKHFPATLASGPVGLSGSALENWFEIWDSWGAPPVPGLVAPPVVGGVAYPGPVWFRGALIGWFYRDGSGGLAFGSSIPPGLSVGGYGDPL